MFKVGKIVKGVTLVQFSISSVDFLSARKTANSALKNKRI